MNETKVVNLKSDVFDIYIGRGSIWGNPFKISKKFSRKDVIIKYEAWIKEKRKLEPEVYNLSKLKGKRLGCYCRPLACHGDVLVKLIEGDGRWIKQY